MKEQIVWLIVTSPCCLLFTGIGIFAWKRKEPMWFWAGSTVEARELRDVPAYNRANGIMWIAFSGVLWLSAFAGLWSIIAGGVILAAGCVIGIPVLIIVYKRIYRKYKI